MYAVLRVRGSIGVRKGLRDTMKILGLTRANHLVLVKEERPVKKMVEKVSSFATYGEISEGTLEMLLRKRGRLSGDKRIGGEFLKGKKIKSFEEMAKKIIEGSLTLKGLGVKRVFRLKPPSKGFERGGIKKPVKNGGALGYRGEKINSLLQRMI